MSPPGSTISTAATPVPAPVARGARDGGAQRRGDGWLYAAIALLLASAWQFSRAGFYSASSDLGYWMGVGGATMMVLLFAYPLRKRSARLANWGQARHWFVVHMVLGVLGPVLVLAHSAFRVGSLNAGVALVSMLVVAASGVAGRFIYLRIHRGLGGELQSFEALRAAIGLAGDAARGPLAVAPQALQRLATLERHAGRPGDAWVEHLRRLVVLPLQLRRERRAIAALASDALRHTAVAERWDEATLRRRARRARRAIAEHADAVQRIAQRAAYTRLFSLWHLLHVPFVLLMVVCAIVHVVAVHAY